VRFRLRCLPRSIQRTDAMPDRDFSTVPSRAAVYRWNSQPYAGVKRSGFERLVAATSAPQDEGHGNAVFREVR